MLRPLNPRPPVPMGHEPSARGRDDGGGRGGPVVDERRCRLCGGRDAKERPQRLGRYALTCDACEAKRGAHLRETERATA
jgi:hypothetical protein